MVSLDITKDLVGADIASGVVAGALKHPEKIALSFEGQNLTFSQLTTRIQQVANLARLKLSEEEVEAYTNQLENTSRNFGILNVIPPLMNS